MPTGLKVFLAVFVLLSLTTLFAPAAISWDWLAYWVCAVVAYAVGFGEALRQNKR